MLELRNVSKLVGGVSHISDVSLTLAHGSLNVLLGPTLSGKTSLMRLMAGLDQPSSGTVWFDGKDVTGVPVQKRNVAMVYQQFINYPAMTVYENIASPLIIYSPRLIKPGRIEYPTVHADILPTLLDAMGAAFDARQFQGESALRGNPARNYVFTYGNENTLTAVSKDLQKVSLLRTQKNCRSFDLRRDPAETQNRGCSTGNEQYRALEAFYRVQPGMLKGYNELCNKQGC